MHYITLSKQIAVNLLHLFGICLFKSIYIRCGFVSRICVVVTGEFIISFACWMDRKHSASLKMCSLCIHRFRWIDAFRAMKKRQVSNTRKRHTNVEAFIAGDGVSDDVHIYICEWAPNIFCERVCVCVCFDSMGNLARSSAKMQIVCFLCGTRSCRNGVFLCRVSPTYMRNDPLE